jgi:hypothetical protein
MSRSLLLLTAASVLGLAGAAQACDFDTAKGQTALKLPAFMLPHGPSQPGNLDAAHNVIGTWLVDYVVNGTTVIQALVQWHPDGTEWQSGTQPVTSGNICVGSWKSVDFKHVSRYHMGWLFTDGVVSGYAIETETNKVTGKGTYAGEFDTKYYDKDGNLTKEVMGTTSGVKFAQ